MARELCVCGHPKSAHHVEPGFYDRRTARTYCTRKSCNGCTKYSRRVIEGDSNGE